MTTDDAPLQRWRTDLTKPPQRLNGAMLLHHLADMHSTEARPYLKRMETEVIGTVAAEAYEVIEKHLTRPKQEAEE